MNLRPFLLIAFATMPGTEIASVRAQTMPEYRLLKVSEPNPGEIPRRLNYFVSVANFLDRSAVERLICKVIEKEKPSTATNFGIAIYQGLEKISDFELVFGGEPYEHDLALYVSSGGFLTMMRDLQGRRIRPVITYEFDHSRACPNR